MQDYPGFVYTYALKNKTTFFGLHPAGSTPKPERLCVLGNQEREGILNSGQGEVVSSDNPACTIHILPATLCVKHTSYT